MFSTLNHNITGKPFTFKFFVCHWISFVSGCLIHLYWLVWRNNLIAIWQGNFTLSWQWKNQVIFLLSWWLCILKEVKGTSSSFGTMQTTADISSKKQLQIVTLSPLTLSLNPPCSLKFSCFNFAILHVSSFIKIL